MKITLRGLLKLYLKFIDTLKANTEVDYTRFIYWLKNYIGLKKSERTFKSTFLPKYQEGQIIFTDFGCGIGHEFNYPHYAVILNCHDKKNNSLITVVPLTSKKEKHNKLRSHEYELATPIQVLLGNKALNDFDLNKPEYHELRDDIVKMAQSKLSKDAFDKKYGELVQQGVQTIINNNADIMSLRQKMKEGSIVECNQIRTISKARIISPKKSSDPLYNVRVTEGDLSLIRLKLMRQFIFKNIDSLTTESVK